MSPHENRTHRTEPAKIENQATCEGLDLARSVERLGEQLGQQFSDIASEPLPENMLELLEKLNRAAE